jgi:hypothetical protein
MNKYSKIYFNELNQKNAFLIPAARAAFSAAKPIVSTGVKNLFNAAKPVVSSAIQRGVSAAKPLAEKTIKSVGNFSSGITGGIGSMARGYRGILESNQPVKNKAMSLLSNTFTQPWNTATAIVKSRGGIKNVSAKDIGTVFGVATPGLAVNNAIDTGIDSAFGQEPQNQDDAQGDLWSEINRRNKNVEYR